MIFRLSRLVYVVWTLGRYDAILPKEYQNLLPPSAKFLGKLLRIGAKHDGDLGARLSIALEKLGAVWIKLGQLLATRPDIVGALPAQALCGLKDKVAPFDDAAARKILARDFTGGDVSKLSDIFGELGSVIAAASVAQVYKINPPDGGQFALKILRPNVEREIARDIAALRLGAKMIEVFSPKSRRLEPIALVETIAESLSKETDLRREAGACDAFGQIAALDNYIHVPKVDWSKSTKNVLVTEWVDGVPLTQAGAMEGQNRKELADCVNRSFLCAALEHGFFHADMHEGNLLVTKDGKLYAVDFGIMGRLGAKEQRYLAEIIYSFLHRDYRRAARVHFEAGYVPNTYDEGEYGVALRTVGEPIWGRKASEVSMGRVLAQLFDVTEQFGMKLRPELVLQQKTMVQVEGVARSIDPDHDIWESSRPIVERFMKRELGPEGMMERTLEHLGELSHAIMRLPALIDKLEKMVEKDS
ncbi:MAG: ubiquinone biosynthesis protein [Hyphomonadaceae bacterium]|nr:MAG: ubiquinone biosynthesis protein [Hyphomonadaceae bacterium]KAF0184755.1 MAG: ubiquinone biosynthesis protein [Hyphomonadaceae bacterium]